MIKKLFSQTLLAAILMAGFFSVQKQAQAAVRCETQYGGGEVCVRTGELQINKRVWNPQTKEFVDNLGLSGYRFAPGEEIIFELEIRNVGDDTFSEVQVTDTLPSHVELSSGNLSFKINDLIAGETEKREIKVKVVSSDKFPSDKTLICEVNTAEVKSGSEQDKDTAQVCLERKVMGITTIPVTGPENWLLVFSLAGLTSVAGLVFIKKALKTS